MIVPKSLDALLADDRLHAIQGAIVEVLKTLNPGLAIVRHPGKVDVSELIAKSVVAAPGVGIGWSRIRQANLSDGSFSLNVEWVAYIVAEAKSVGNRRVEKEAIGLAIGARILKILGDDESVLWGSVGLLPPETAPPPELKPLFTVRDASQGVAYYTVTWTQTVVDVGQTEFPTGTATFVPEHDWLQFESQQALEAMRPYLPVLQEPGDA